MIGASEQSREAEHRDDRASSTRGPTTNGAAFYPVHPTYETVLGHPVYKSIVDVPGDIDLAIILTGQGRRHLRGGARTQGQVRGDLRGRLLGDRHGGREARSPARRRSCARATSACSARTRTSTRSRTSATDLDRPVDRARHAVGPPGPAGVPGPGARHPAHALGADRQRGRPRVRRLRPLLRRPARGRRDRRATSRGSRTAARSCSRPTTRRSCASRS